MVLDINKILTLQIIINNKNNDLIVHCFILAQTYSN